MEKKLYVPEEDSYFANPYIDIEEWRDTPVRHYYVHGGFRGTEINGANEARFCFYFPEKEKYEGRFFQYLSPAPEDEHESEHLTGEDDKISFALTHGAYYVVSNQGGFILGGDPTRLYRTSANSAEFGRKIACRLYDYEHRPYGYVFGGSGGSFKTISCMEMTKVWDGGVPYVIANPMATPNVFCPRVRAMRVLGKEGMEKVMDHMDAGGSGELYEGLTKEQAEILQEATKMGFPKRAWFCGPFMGDGALMVLAPYIYAVYPQYFTDFWTKEGFAGADPESSESKARVQFITTVKELIKKEEKKEQEEFTSVDDSWQNTMTGNMTTPKIRMEEIPPEDAYLFHCRIRVLSGKAKGKESAIETIEDGVITVSSAFDGSNGKDALEGLVVGDQIMIDNSDYLAMQTLQRHQVPDETYHVYEQYRNPDGTPKYPQLPILLGPIIALNGGGSVPDGDIQGKVIAVCSLLDESALPWHGDWYLHAVERHLGAETKENFRLYYNDNCIHGDSAGVLYGGAQFTVDYLGMLHQALLDVAAWCEKGIAPTQNTTYTYTDGQIEVPFEADERHGIQPVVHSLANGERCARVKAGEPVRFTAKIKVPAGTGKVTEAAWDFERTDDFSHTLPLQLSEDGEGAYVEAVHTFETPGTYFPVIKVKSNRKGTLEDIFTQCKNLDRVRVIVS